MPSPPRFGPTQRLQRAYARGINAIVRRVLPPIGAGQTLEGWLQELAERTQHADVQEASELLARRMVNWQDIKNARTWREAAARSQQSRQLYALLQREMAGPVGLRVQRLIADNARYISSVPLEAARTLVDEVRKAQQAGARPGTVSKMMRQRFSELLSSRIHFISRTETAKASTALTQARCEELNIDWYVWLSSKDARVRHSHAKMNGVLTPWSEPPAPDTLFPVGQGRSTLGHYHAGDCPNCRCTQRVVLTLDDAKFPARVYWHGAVHHMNKQQFRQIAVSLERRAA